MIRIALVLAPALALAMGCASAARADDRLVTEPVVAELVSVGQAYWHARHLAPCPSPTITAVKDLHTDDGHAPAGVADMGGCDIWLDADWLYDSEVHQVSRYNDTEFCTVIVHELGHTAFLVDSPITDGVVRRDVMAGDPPRECEAWARARALKAVRYACHPARRPTACASRLMRRD